MRHLKRLGVFGAVTTIMLGAGIAFAAWTATGTGSGSAKATSAVALSTVDASASTFTNQLSPFNSGDVIVTIHNPNPYGVTVTAINGNGTITPDSGHAACSPTGVTYTNQSGSFHVNANSDATFTLANAAHMDNTSVDACQGATFTIPVSLSGASA